MTNHSFAHCQYHNPVTSKVHPRSNLLFKHCACPFGMHRLNQLIDPTYSTTTNPATAFGIAHAFHAPPPTTNRKKSIGGWGCQFEHSAISALFNKTKYVNRELVRWSGLVLESTLTSRRLATQLLHEWRWLTFDWKLIEGSMIPSGKECTRSL